LRQGATLFKETGRMTLPQEKRFFRPAFRLSSWASIRFDIFTIQARRTE
jgi:hypothetical protein